MSSGGGGAGRTEDPRPPDPPEGEVVFVFEKFFSLTVLDIPAAEMRKAAS